MSGRRGYGQPSASTNARDDRVSRQRGRVVWKTRGSSKQSKLADKQVNTLIELRMKEVAQKEIQKQRKLLTSRKYIFHRYNPATNEFFNLPSASHLVSWTGKVIELSNISQVDIEMAVNAPQSDDPDTAANENLDGDGLAQGAPTQGINGRRESNQIYIQSVSAQLRIRSQRLGNNETDEYGRVHVKYAFVLWRDEEVIMSDPTQEPDAQELLMMNVFGYAGKLDLSLEQTFHSLKTKVLCKGETFLNMNEDYTSEQWKTIFKKFEQPIKIQYAVASQNGQECNQKLYFVCRSSIPDSADNGVKPTVYAVTKVNYWEA